MTSINLIGYDNGIGLSRDIRLLAAALRTAGYAVDVSALKGDRVGRRTGVRGVIERFVESRRGPTRTPGYDLSIMIERVRPVYAARARINALLVNPDWFKPSDREHFDLLAGLLVKTREAAARVAALDKPTHYVGFTSEDRMDAGVARDKTFFHLGGHSRFKGTARLLEVWRRHPEWPVLTVVQHLRRKRGRVTAPNIVHRCDYVDDAELKRLQNENAFHVCCSETEGFGHYIVEAMSTGAVVLATDAPPMNELVTRERGVPVAYDGTGRHLLATTYRFSESALEGAVERCIAMTDAERLGLGRRARAWFEQNDAGFPARLREAVDAMLASA
ncbi:MAG TPA: glycosyltransferase [Rhodanobacteraceae bacterium]|nr:glycosyltransferase [Rhodanobacteraceae bacterium]